MSVNGSSFLPKTNPYPKLNEIRANIQSSDKTNPSRPPLVHSTKGKSALHEGLHVLKGAIKQALGLSSK